MLLPEAIPQLKPKGRPLIDMNDAGFIEDDGDPIWMFGV
jgi:hypothetical protein